VRTSGTEAELLLRRALWHSGLRYRLRTTKALPGKPDIVFPGARLAVFVDGCFWHGCPIHYQAPQANASFWCDKLAVNVARDRRVDKQLQALGWTVVRVWEHAVRPPELAQTMHRIEAALHESQIGRPRKWTF
jgi:DNA mismatch endonuclease, patch repair protein